MTGSEGKDVRIPARSLMIQGTTSNAGKSALCTGLCRLLTDSGFRVSPFKPQNMALNSAVSIDGGEIGRAQAVQAQACRVGAHSDMNPVLLKPNSATGAQVIVQGKALTNMTAARYHQHKPQLMPTILESYHRLHAVSDFVIVEGAGSPAEINLRENDLANMGFALAVDCPVVIVADIDRGGVFAHLAGTYALLSDDERDLVRGFVINKFRGDTALLDSGLTWLAEHTGKPVLGVVPYLEDLYFDDEDSLSRSVRTVNKKNNVKLTVVVPQLPRVSNQTDFEPLLLNPQVEVNFVADARLAPPCDLIVLPGSKSVRDDLKWLKSKGWAELIARHLRYGGKVIGLCGGFQMLGRAIHDPFGVESEPGSSFGLGLLDIETTLEQSKRLALVKGNLTINGAFVEGYEIHMGTTYGAGANNPFKRPLLAREDGGENQYEGLISDDDQIIGTYLHGLFDRKEAAQTILAWAGLVQDEIPDFLEIREKNIHRFAELLRGSLDLDNLAAILNIDTARLQ